MFQRRKVRTAFGDYLSPEVIRRLLTRPDLVQPTVKHFQFVVILFDEPDPQQISTLMTGLVRTLFDHKATVTSVLPSLVVGLFRRSVSRWELARGTPGSGRGVA